MDNQVLWEEYTEKKQTLKQLAERYRCSARTIQRRLDAFQGGGIPPRRRAGSSC
ncbi:MAG: helix-turn-helix domain-containing protein [Bacteroides sp.]